MKALQKAHALKAKTVSSQLVRQAAVNAARIEPNSLKKVIQAPSPDQELSRKLIRILGKPPAMKPMPPATACGIRNLPRFADPLQSTGASGPGLLQNAGAEPAAGQSKTFPARAADSQPIGGVVHTGKKPDSKATKTSGTPGPPSDKKTQPAKAKAVKKPLGRPRDHTGASQGPQPCL